MTSRSLPGALLLALLPLSLHAQDWAGQERAAIKEDEISAPPKGGEESAAEAAKQLANPVAALISVPLQNNVDLGLGPKGDGLRYTLNFQPVVPLPLNKDWTVISRTILPFIDQEKVLGTSGGQWGLGDTTQSFFFSPAKPGPLGIIWGAGPVLLFPTATNDLLGTEKYGAGPTLVALRQEKGWTYGFLVNHIWSYAGNDNRATVDSTFIQPFLSYTTKKAFTAGINTESTYDWTADQWTVPINLQLSQVLKIDQQLVSLGVGGRYYAVTPNNGPNWGCRLTVTFLFPEGQH